MRSTRLGALCLTLCAGSIAALTAPPARADQWTVERAGLELYRIAGQNIFIRTDGCDDAPATGVVNVQKEGGKRRLTFTGSAASCTVRDFLVSAKVPSDQYTVLLTQDQSRNWYRVTDGDLYLKTVGCISRAMSETAMLDLNRDGTGWLRFIDGRRCAVEHAFQRFNP